MKKSALGRFGGRTKSSQRAMEEGGWEVCRRKVRYTFAGYRIPRSALSKVFWQGQPHNCCANGVMCTGPECWKVRKQTARCLISRAVYVICTALSGIYNAMHAPF